MTAAGLTVVWDPRFRSYDFGPGHPFNEASRESAVHLLEAALTTGERAAITWERAVEPADLTALRSFHDAGYLEQIRAAGASRSRRPLDGGDTPAFPGCFEASARIVAGTARAVRLVRDEGGIAFAPAGGLHHAHRDHASGFCIFNDLAVGIAAALESGSRVAYIDIDVHHGDGVMYGFYGVGRLLDIDFHQDGRTLFPGTGRVTETGVGDGAGLKVNVPLPPGAGDEALVPLAQRLVPPLLREFRPDLVVVQHGVDGHWGDPLAQLQYTPAGYAEVDRLLLALAREFGGRLVVTGGGGYDPGNVARTLARTAYPLAGIGLPSGDVPLPEAWRAEFFETFGWRAPSRWIDPPELQGSSWGAASEERTVRSLEEALGRRFPAP
ncbi:MAG TPA: acetoin utilization protein AcuC [Thermoplasmata archaeon]|nr:acetoin utilization protein AcuC [Thermoplasmata archaeon]